MVAWVFQVLAFLLWYFLAHCYHCIGRQRYQCSLMMSVPASSPFSWLYFSTFFRDKLNIWMQDACVIFNILMLVELHETLGTLARLRYMLEEALQLKALVTKIVPRFSVDYLITGHNTCNTLSCSSFKTNWNVWTMNCDGDNVFII